MKLQKPPRQQSSLKKSLQASGAPSPPTKQSRSKDARSVAFEQPLPTGQTRRQTSANGPQQRTTVRRGIKIVPDQITSNMGTLKRVQHSKSGKEIQTQLSDQYKARKATLDRQLQKVIDGSKVAMMQITRKSEAEKAEEKRKLDESQKGSDLMQMLGIQKETTEEKKKDEVLADGFVRSKRNQQLRVKDEIMSQIATIEEEKIAIIQKLNQALVKLDQINSNKRELGNKLLEQVKFVRDLQRAASNGDDIEGIVSIQMKVDFKREKELNKRLSDELKKCEQERLRILQRLKLMSGEKEVVVHSTDGLQKTYKVTQVNIQNILDDLKSNKGRIVNQEDLVAQSREMLRVTEEEVLIQQRQIEDLYAERDSLHEKINQIDGRYRLMFDNIEGDKYQRANLHRMHVKLLATRQFEESLQKVIAGRRKGVLNQMFKVTRGYVNQFGAVYRLRTVLIASNHRLQRNAMASWYKVACDPIMLVKQNLDIPRHFDRIISGHGEFNKDFEQWMIDNYKNHQKQVALRDTQTTIEKFWRRVTRTFFERWKHRLQKSSKGIEVIDKFLSKVRLRRQFHAYAKWKQFMIDQDFTVRLQGFSVMAATQRLEEQILFAWRSWAKSARFKRHALLRKSLRCMRVQVHRRKNLNLMAISALMFKKNNNKSILKQTFDALRQNKEEEKVFAVTKMLVEQEQPMTDLLKMQVDNLQEFRVLTSRQNGMKAIISLGRRQVSLYFAEWREQTQRVRVGLDNKMKQKLIKLYYAKLQKGFDGFKNNIQHKEIVMQIAQMDDIYMNNMDIQEVNRKNDIQIKQAVKHGRSRATHSVRRILEKAILAKTKRGFDKWRKVNTKVNTMQDGSNMILRKIRQRLIRMAFNRYRDCANQKEQADRNEHRSCEVADRLQFRAKRRCYQAMKTFCKKHKRARKYMKTLVSRLDTFNKDVAYRRWQDFWRSCREKKLQENQTMLIETVLSQQQTDGLVANDLQAARTEHHRMDKSYKTQCSKTLQKWAIRLINASMTSAFNTWKNQGANLGYRDRVLKLCRTRMVRAQRRAAFNRWRGTKETTDIMMVEECLTSMDVNLDCQTMEISKAQQNRKAQAVKHGRDRSLIDNQKAKVDTHHQRIADLMTQKNQNCFMTSKRRDIFNRWREYARDRRRSVRRLALLMEQSLNQRTFNKLRDYQKTSEKKEEFLKLSDKMIRRLQRYWLKRAMQQWRASEFITTMQLIQETSMETQQVSDDFSAKKESIKVHHTAVCSGRQGKKTLQMWFENWRKFAHEQRDTRERTTKVEKALYAKRARNALQKWKSRAEVTQKMRSFLKRGKFVKKRANLKSTFKAWYEIFKIEKNFALKMANFGNSVRLWSLNTGFGALKERARDVKERRGKDLNRSQQLLLSGMARYCDNTKRGYFYQWKSFTDVCNRREVKMKAAWIKIQAKEHREYFDRWKHNALGEGVRQENEDGDGPTNIECFNLRQTNLNLMRMLKDDGITNQQIQDVQNDVEESYKTQVEKSLCRFLCKQGDDLYLLPAALDRWKKYSQLKKLWRRVLRDCEIRATRTDDVCAKLWAFRRMQYTYNDRKEELKTRPIDELRNLAVKGVEELDRLADNVEFGQKETDSLSEQRDVLLKGQISGQKLAFALSRDNQHFIKMRTISRMYDHGSQRITGKVEEALKANLDRIAKIKESINMLEGQNDELAKQNDQFRVGAMDGINMVRHVENLTQDRDKLSVDLADKAITIRKLLEDNSYLRGRIESVTGQKELASRQLEETQMRVAAAKDELQRERYPQHSLRQEDSPTRENDMNQTNMI